MWIEVQCTDSPPHSPTISYSPSLHAIALFTLLIPTPTSNTFWLHFYELAGRKTQTFIWEIFLLEVFSPSRRLVTSQKLSSRKIFLHDCLQLCTEHDYGGGNLSANAPGTTRRERQSSVLFVYTQTLHTLLPSKTRKNYLSFIHTCCILKQIANLLSQTKHKTNLRMVCLKIHEIKTSFIKRLRGGSGENFTHFGWISLLLSWSFKNRSEWRNSIGAWRDSFAFNIFIIKHSWHSSCIEILSVHFFPTRGSSFEDLERLEI